VVDEVRAKGVQVVVLLSHNGIDIDLKMAGRVTGIDAILGGHTHDGVPVPVVVKNRSGETLVTNVGANSKFLGVLDFDVREGRVQGFRYKLLPVFANLLPADAAMQAPTDSVRAPYQARPGSAKRWPSANGCCTGAAISTAPGTRSSSTPSWTRRVQKSPSRPASAGAPACCRARPSRAM